VPWSDSHTAHGLTGEEVEQRRTIAGLNALPRPRRVSLWRRLFLQLVHFFAVMLWIAGGLAILAGMPQLGLAIFVVILLNGVFAFVQEYRAEKAAERLQALLPRSVTVIRDGRRQSVDAVELVPDDVVALTAGDRISADLRVSQVDGSRSTAPPLPAKACRPIQSPASACSRHLCRRG
jgi:magnesium-transporting ATPase (P-type)